MKNIHLHYTGTINKVSIAVKKANEVLESEDFYDQIRAYRKFDNSTLSPEVIAKLMQYSGHKIAVTVNWLRPLIKTTHNSISLSAWGFSPHMPTGVNTLIYETVSSIDLLYDLLNHKTEHRDSSSLTAPWLIASIAEIMVKPETTYIKTEHSTLL